MVQGPGYKILILVASLLLAANVSYTFNAIGFYEWAKANAEDSGVYAWNCVMMLGQAFYDLGFCLGHWILAIKYFKIAKNMPRVLKEEKSH